jgi:hypothetical protein
MRLYSSYGLLGDSAKQFIYNWQPHRKTTWLWIKETSRKNNGREEQWTSLAVMLYQGIAKKTQAKIK